MIVTGEDPLSMTGLAVSLSLIAMAWNYIFNVIFDHYFGSDRYKRGLSLRIGHGLGFELGMIILSFPVIMWTLKLDFLTVLIMDAGAALFFFIYAIIFNGLYDIARNRFMGKQSIVS